LENSGSGILPLFQTLDLRYSESAFGCAKRSEAAKYSAAKRRRRRKGSEHWKMERIRNDEKSVLTLCPMTLCPNLGRMIAAKSTESAEIPSIGKRN